MGDWGEILGSVIIAMTIILVIGGLFGSFYVNRKMKYDNFQETIKDLSQEQKCIHICGFQFGGGYFENYKFCMEKCDRISERLADCGE